MFPVLIVFSIYQYHNVENPALFHHNFDSTMIK